VAMMAAHAKFTMNGSPSATWPTASTTTACAGAALATAATTLAAADATATCNAHKKTRTRQSFVHTHTHSIASFFITPDARIHRSVRVLRLPRLESPRPSGHDRSIDRSVLSISTSPIGATSVQPGEIRSVDDDDVRLDASRRDRIRSVRCVFSTGIHRARAFSSSSTWIRIGPSRSSPRAV